MTLKYAYLLPFVDNILWI